MAATNIANTSGSGRAHFYAQVSALGFGLVGLAGLAVIIVGLRNAGEQAPFVSRFWRKDILDPPRRMQRFHSRLYADPASKSKPQLAPDWVHLDTATIQTIAAVTRVERGAADCSKKPLFFR